MPPLSKPLFEQGIFVYLYLKCGTESDVMFDLGLHFMIEAHKVFLRKLRHKQLKPEFLLTFFKTS